MCHPTVFDRILDLIISPLEKLLYHFFPFFIICFAIIANNRRFQVSHQNHKYNMIN